MKAIRNHLYGIQVTFEHLFKGELMVFFIPGIVVGLGFFFLFDYTAGLSESAESLDAVPLIGTYATSAVKGTLSVFDAILLEIFKFIVLTLLSPFNGMLSERFDNRLTGNQFEGGVVRMINDILRAILLVVLALIFEFFFLGIWWFISWIFGFGILDPIVYFLISSFFFGFAFYDYSLERYGIGIFSSWGVAFSNMLHMIITGGLFTLLFMIPIVGVIIAPVIVTMISTAAYLKMRGNSTPPTKV